MSALAARRAAAVAGASAALQPPDKSLPKAVAAAPPSPAQSALHFDMESDTSSEASSSTVLSNKRRRIERSPPKKVRYFAKAALGEAAEASTPAGPPTPRQLRGRRAFSPSAPASDSGVDHEASESGSAASDREFEPEKGEDVQLAWSAASTPGPSRVRGVDEPASTQGTSRFEPEWGVNLVKLTPAEIGHLGLESDALGTGDGVAVSLSSSENLILAGMFTITPLQGPVDLLSTTLHPSTASTHQSYPVFAPTSHPLPIISPSNLSPAASPSLAQLLPSTFRTEDNNANPRTVFIIRELRCGLDGLRHGAVPGFSRIWLDQPGSWGLSGVHPVIGSFPTPVSVHITPQTWQSALSALQGDDDEGDTDVDTDTAEPVVALVRGPKRSGKSTVARAAVNRLLERHGQVAWLECDLGQGEFGCGGVVGLWIIDRPVLSPPFTHPQLPRRAHYFGAYSPLSCPDEYISAVRHLIDYYRYELQYPLVPSTSASDSGRRGDVVPLVVNTQGWVKGLGEELLLAIEEAARPTHTFAFEQLPPIEPSYIGAGWTSSPILHTAVLPSYGGDRKTQTFILEPAPVSPLQARHTAADLRVLSMMSYFHARLSPSLLTTWNYSTPILAMQPWQIELGVAISAVYLIGEGADGVIAEDLNLALNGSVVALAASDTSTLPVDGVYVQGRPPPSLDACDCLGLGLIRAIRPTIAGAQPTAIQLVTPLLPSVLARVNAIIKNGAMELPLCGMVDWKSGESAAGLAGMAWDEVPFLDVGMAGGVAVDKRRFRRNLMRKGI